MDSKPIDRAADKTLTDSILLQVREGMTVYDREGKDVGKVEHIYFGEVNEKADARGEGPATARDPDGRPQGMVVTPIPTESGRGYAGAVLPAFNENEVPDVLRKRLLRLGFVQVHSGIIFGKNRYILPDQIDNVAADGVHLKVTRDELIKQ